MSSKYAASITSRRDVEHTAKGGLGPEIAYTADNLMSLIAPSAFKLDAATEEAGSRAVLLTKAIRSMSLAARIRGKLSDKMLGASIIGSPRDDSAAEKRALWLTYANIEHLWAMLELKSTDGGYYPGSVMQHELNHILKITEYQLFVFRTERLIEEALSEAIVEKKQSWTMTATVIMEERPVVVNRGRTTGSMTVFGFGPGFGHTYQSKFGQLYDRTFMKASAPSGSLGITVDPKTLRLCVLMQGAIRFKDLPYDLSLRKTEVQTQETLHSLANTLAVPVDVYSRLAEFIKKAFGFNLWEESVS
jgi:hypothetical protein